MEKSRGALRADTIVNSGNEKYLVMEVLGSGGFGITYKVLRLSDRRVMALKEYFPDKLCERGEGNTISYLQSNREAIETGIDDFLTEAGRLNRQNLAHPNIVAVDEAFRANHTAYYAMEYVAGDTLRRYLTRNGKHPFTVEQTLSVMRPILEAVNLLHKNRLTHLDIKPDNILLTKEADDSLRPVLIDFGQSKHYDRKGKATSTLTNAGCSDGFAPPEQYLGLPEFTPQADIYAICATMLYLLSGRYPLKSTDMSGERIKEMIGGRVADNIREAITEGMVLDKALRIQSVEKLAEALGVEIGGGDPDASVTRLLKVKKKRAGIDAKKYGMTAIGIAAAGLAVWGIIWLATRPGPSPSELLTAAIKENNVEEIKRFALLDSTRAFLPYSEFLLKDGQLEESKIYARKALDSPDSVRAKSIIDNAQRMKAEMLEAQRVEPVGYEANAVSEMTNREESAASGNQKIEEVAGKPEQAAIQPSAQPTKPTPEPKPDYATEAETYLNSRNYDKADEYAHKALSTGEGVQKANSVIERLQILGYYDIKKTKK